MRQPDTLQPARAVRQSEHEPLPTLVTLTAFSEGGTFTRRVSGRWTAEQRCEEVLTARVAFYREVQRLYRRATIRTDIWVELPLFGWTQVPA